MKFILLLILFFSFAFSACTKADKVKCMAASVGCGALCACDFPVCECCVGCVACVTATSADCCECLFPDWDGCTSTYLMSEVQHLVPYYRNLTQTHDLVEIMEKRKAKESKCGCIYSGNQFSCGAVFENRICCNDGWKRCDSYKCKC